MNTAMIAEMVATHFTVVMIAVPVSFLLYPVYRLIK